MSQFERRRGTDQCEGPIVCFSVSGVVPQLGVCRCGLIIVGLGHDEIPPDHQHAPLIPEGMAA
jgi:hypothetical protein